VVPKTCIRPVWEAKGAELSRNEGYMRRSKIEQLFLRIVRVPNQPKLLLVMETVGPVANFFRAVSRFQGCAGS